MSVTEAILEEDEEEDEEQKENNSTVNEMALEASKTPGNMTLNNESSIQHPGGGGIGEGV